MDKDLEYKRADKFFSKERMKDIISEDIAFTPIMNYILITLIVLVIFIGLIRFPLDQFLSGNIEGIKLSFGIPFKFLEFDLNNPEKNPANLWGLVGDLGIYLITAYLIGIVIKFIVRYYKFRFGGGSQLAPRLFNQGVRKEVIDISLKE